MKSLDACLRISKNRGGTKMGYKILVAMDFSKIGRAHV